MHSLPLFHILKGKPVIVLGEGEAGAAKHRLVERAGALVVDESHSGARLAFIALAEPDAAAARLRARGLLVNVADRPDLCDFTVPSLLERDPVLVAVGTGGASAGLAKHLRLRLEALLPQSLGPLAAALGAARARLRAKFPAAAERRRALDLALGEGGALDPLAGAGAEELESWLADAPLPAAAAQHLIELASDDPEDLTLRQARLLGSADVLLLGEGIPRAILARARADAVRLAAPFAGDLPPGMIVELRRA